MSSDAAPFSERRRSERVLLRVPVRIYGKSKEGRRLEEDAEAVIVSRHGALLRSTSAFQTGTTVDLLNKFSQKQMPFRVIWCSDLAASGRWDVGVESDNAAGDFWGIHFPGQRGS